MNDQTKQAFNAVEALKGAWNYLPNQVEKGVSSLMHEIPEGLKSRVGVRPTFRRNKLGIFDKKVSESTPEIRDLFSAFKGEKFNALMNYLQNSYGMGKDVNTLQGAVDSPQARSWANDLWSNMIFADPKGSSGHRLYKRHPSVSHAATQVAQGGALAGGAMAIPNLIHRLNSIKEVKKDRVEEKEATEKIAEGNPLTNIKKVLFGDSPQNYLQGTANPVFSDWRTLAGLLGVGAGSYALANQGVNAGTNAYSDRFMDQEEQDRRRQLVTEMQNSYKSAGYKEAAGDAYSLGTLGALWALLSIPAFGIGRNIGKDTTKVNQFNQLQQAFNKLEASNRPRNVFTVAEGEENALDPTSYKTLSTNSIPFPVSQKKKNFTDDSLKLASAKEALEKVSSNAFTRFFSPTYRAFFKNDKHRGIGKFQRNSGLINSAMAHPLFSRFVPKSMWNLSGKLPQMSNKVDFSRFGKGESVAAFDAFNKAMKDPIYKHNLGKKILPYVLNEGNQSVFKNLQSNPFLKNFIT